MKIALLHNHYNEDHLAEVMADMGAMGAPTIKVLDLDFDDMYQALEGSHRLRACERLLITPVIEIVDGNVPVGTLGLDIDVDDPSVPVDEAGIGDYENYKINIEGSVLVILDEWGDVAKSASE